MPTQIGYYLAHNFGIAQKIGNQGLNIKTCLHRIERYWSERKLIKRMPTPIGNY